MTELLSDQAIVARVLTHIDHGTTDLGTRVWREPVANYRSEARLAAELNLLRRLPIPFCPSAALSEAGSYVARSAAGTPLLVVRGKDGEVRAFRNACRHRGMRLADGSGCAKAFVCGYHGWAYRLDGSLRHVPHGAGFPGLDQSTHGLVAVAARERAGLVFVDQSSNPDFSTLDDLPLLISSTQQIFAHGESTTDANWKLVMEGNLEGYHIKPTHPTSFYPYGFDNLTVIEPFGNNCRVTFPFRRIEKLRALPPEQRTIDGMVTYVYHLFPNVIVAVLSNHTTLSILEPVSIDRTRFITYRLTHASSAAEASHERASRDATFVGDTGGKEDAAITRAIQAGIASDANDCFTYGLFEQAIVHFHENLHAKLA